MSCVPILRPAPVPAPGVESTIVVPDEVRRLLQSAPGPEADEAWHAFLSAYSDLLLRAAAIHGADYDAVLDRYAYMLDELRRDDCRRLRRFVADGRACFATWLAVVARRLSLDHHRTRYGRLRRRGDAPAARCAGETRRRLADLRGAVDDLDVVEDPAARPADEVLDDQRRLELLAGAIALLPPADRMLLRLRFEQELTAREIAGRVGLPTPFHVYRRLQAVCATLRARMPATTGSHCVRAVARRTRS